MVDRVRRIIVSPKKACCIAVIIFLCILTIALIAAFARPYASCSCFTADVSICTPCVSRQNATNRSTVTLNIPISTNGEPFPWDFIRLPQFVEPLSYSISLRPNLTTFVNSGTVEITFRLNESQKFIILHVRGLELSNYHLKETKSEKSILVKKTLIYEKHEQLYVEFDSVLSTTVSYILIIDFKGILTEQLKGFYLSSYIMSSGEKRYLATTHFEPTYARMAFPCFDEPALKATFRVSIVRETRHIALFNMPVAHTKQFSENLIVDYFHETVRMSTYLVAFVISDYQRITAVTSSNVTVAVYSPAELIEQASFALEVATSVLEFYNKFFGIPYPLPKQDLIAIPDFDAGAMENWGLTTYRESAILTHSTETPVAKIQQVAVTIAHELAHQWFGNLVTMSWWNDLWLNEGFASFIENLGISHIKSEWNMMDQFIVTKTQPALHLDALASSHPISVNVNDPSDIESIFDEISYNKGAAIIYMLESFLGTKTLQRGLQTYLNTFKYKNAKTEEFWHVLSQESRAMNVTLNVEAIMDTWTQQTGFPLITIENDGNLFTAKQQRFLVGSSAEQDGVNSEFISKYGYKWHVPLTYTTDKSATTQLVWLNLNDAKFKVLEKIQWIKFNTNQTGFYRVNYTEEMWHSLVSALKKDHTVFSAADRASLLDDAFTLVRNNVLDPTILLQMTQYLVKEKDGPPWITALEGFFEMGQALKEKSSFPDFKRYVRKLLVPIVRDLGWDDRGSHLRRLLRPIILLEATRYGSSDVIDKALKVFKEWKEKGVRSVPSSLRSVVYDVGIKYGNYSDWQYCWDYYLRTQVSSEKTTVLSALGASTDPWVISQFLQFSLDRQKVRPQNTYIVLKSVVNNPIGRDLTWRFIRSNWEKLIEQFGLDSFAISNVITDTTNQFCNEFDHHEVKSFFDTHAVGSGKRAVKNSLEKIRSKIQWLEKNEKIVTKWLIDNQISNS